jgi:hypothetical protein
MERVKIHSDTVFPSSKHQILCHSKLAFVSVFYGEGFSTCAYPPGRGIAFSQ